jgi:hypothetical protein
MNTRLVSRAVSTSPTGKLGVLYAFRWQICIVACVVVPFAIMSPNFPALLTLAQKMFLK